MYLEINGRNRRNWRKTVHRVQRRGQRRAPDTVTHRVHPRHSPITFATRFRQENTRCSPSPAVPVRHRRIVQKDRTPPFERAYFAGSGALNCGGKSLPYLCSLISMYRNECCWSWFVRAMYSRSRNTRTRPCRIRARSRPRVCDRLEKNSAPAGRVST